MAFIIHGIKFDMCRVCCYYYLRQQNNTGVEIMNITSTIIAGIVFLYGLTILAVLWG